MSAAAVSGGAVQINRPISTRYLVRVLPDGCRKWRLVGGRLRDRKLAASRAARLVAGNYRRAQVLLTADYYEPLIVIDMVQR